MITLEIVEGPDLAKDEDGWKHYAYTVRLTRGSAQMETQWMQGVGITDDPDAADVLESLMLDASSYYNARSFEEWAGDYGYDTDSRKAYALWERIGESAARVKEFLGDDWDDTSTEDASDAARRLVRTQVR